MMTESSSANGYIRDRVFISGRVQGVGYRFSTLNMAQHLGLTGWVRNLPDGRVEAVFEGTPETVEAAIRWCHQGSAAAIVQSVAVEREQPEGVRDFTIRY